MHPQEHEQENRRYYGTPPAPTEGKEQLPPPAEEHQLIVFDTLNRNIEFLEEKYYDDLAEAQRWNTIARGSSISGYGLILIGVVIALTLSITSGPLIGTITGGLTSLSGIVFNVFTNLIANPARIFNNQVEADARLLSEAYKNIATITQREIEIEQFKSSIIGLSPEDQQELQKRFIRKEYDLPGQD